ncbi:MAG: ATP-binding protein [Ilumatobacteraceae bacterium]
MPSPDERGSSRTRRSLELPATTESPALGRRMARAALVEWGCARVVDVVLAVSELVTNAVMDAGSPPTLELTFTSPGVRVEVHDSSHAIPVLNPAAITGGYGLRIVATVSDDWGWELTPTGKLVWATFGH